MLLAFLTFISGIAISAVAIYYSVLGLAAIFAAAVVPIIVMGSILEVSKLVTAWWLKRNWGRAPFLLKTYMLTAVLVLMLITSMGIFGFLSKAHGDQSVPIGDIASQVAMLDDDIKTRKDNIEVARKSLIQLDSQVNEVLSRSTDQNGAERAGQIRKRQTIERETLQKEISIAQAEIVKLNQQRAPIAGKLRAVEAEVGPIKYIAQLIYGDSPDKNVLEKAVVWVIIIIVFVFDPLAVLLLLSSQLSFQWALIEREEKKKLLKASLVNKDPTPVTPVVPVPVVSPTPVPTAPQEVVATPITQESEVVPTPAPVQEHTAVADNNVIEMVNDNKLSIDKPNELPVVDTEEVSNTADTEADDDVIINSAADEAKIAMATWKAENPDDSLKHQRILFKQGLIDKLPWEESLKPVADEENEAAIEAAKWAQEQLDSSKKKVNSPKTKSISYIQNAEQSNDTIWQRVKKSKGE